ncbi:MAG: tRNA (cytidine(56)-2'-O)-methyltransferase, partial [Candidatus Thermoplasmatota archaeon]|nr:tRNA (cytidine(56)-2'-O)-methyltransferase [Candidatus Thermoplasmatota archaeon]
MAEHDVIILRLGYRLGRDPRITTHLALVARALGANRFLFSGDEDERLSENIASVNQRFGGDMVVEHIKSPMAWLRKFIKDGVDGNPPGIAVHLTMYGASYRSVTPTIRRDRPLVVIVGGAKVPSEVFQVSQYNLAVGNQPHSEVAA